MIVFEDESPKDIISKLAYERNSLSNLYTWQLHKYGFDEERIKKLANRYVKVWKVENAYRYDIRMRPTAFLPLWVEQNMDEE